MFGSNGRPTAIAYMVPNESTSQTVPCTRLLSFSECSAASFRDSPSATVSSSHGLDGKPAVIAPGDLDENALLFGLGLICSPNPSTRRTGLENLL